MRLLGKLVLVGMLIGAGPSWAGDCIVSGPAPQLDAQPIAWSFAIAGGQRCLKGLRSAAMLLDQVAVESPAKYGQATVQGYAFSYQAPRDFKGEDVFSVAITGRFRGVAGRSVIEVRVNVR